MPTAFMPGLVIGVAPSRHIHCVQFLDMSGDCLECLVKFVSDAKKPLVIVECDVLLQELGDT